MQWRWFTSLVTVDVSHQDPDIFNRIKILTVTWPALDVINILLLKPISDQIGSLNWCSIQHKYFNLAFCKAVLQMISKNFWTGFFIYSIVFWQYYWCPIANNTLCHYTIWVFYSSLSVFWEVRIWDRSYSHFSLVASHCEGCFIRLFQTTEIFSTSQSLMLDIYRETIVFSSLARLLFTWCFNI